MFPLLKGVRYLEAVLQRLSHLGLNILSLFKACPLFGMSVIGRFHYINKKTAWLLNLRYGINKIFYSNLYLSCFLFIRIQLLLVFYLSQVCHNQMRTWRKCDVCLTFMFYVYKFCKYLIQIKIPFFLLILLFYVINLFEAETCISTFYYFITFLHSTSQLISLLKGSVYPFLYTSTF